MGARWGGNIQGKRVNRNRKPGRHGRSFTEQLGRMVPTLPTNILHTAKQANEDYGGQVAYRPEPKETPA